jgi:hypothetical protein
MGIGRGLVHTRDDFEDRYAEEEGRERAEIANLASSAVVNAVEELVKDGKAVIIQNLTVNVNYASGGGATVRVEGR